MYSSLPSIRYCLSNIGLIVLFISFAAANCQAENTTLRRRFDQTIDIYNECAQDRVDEGYEPITSRADLDAIRNNLTGRFVLWNNINLTGQPFTPIGPGEFQGVFDGCSKRITGLNVPGPGLNSGLFSKIGNLGVVKDLYLSNPTITGRNVGALAGESTGIVTGVLVQGGSVQGEDRVGGLIGWAVYGHVENCMTTLSVTRTGPIGSDSGGVGGVIGVASYGIFRKLASTSQIRGTSSIGGVVGYLHGASLYYSSFRGNITATREGTSYPFSLGPIGGLIGRVGWGAYVHESFATGNITALDSNTQGIGGLVGYGQYEWRIFNSFTNINIQGPSNPTVINPIGGIVGATSNSQTAWIVSSYAAGPIAGGGANVRGLVGKIWSGSVDGSSSYWNRDSTGITTTNGVGTPKSHAQMLTPSTYVNWNGTDVWLLQEGQYPALRRVFTP